MIKFSLQCENGHEFESWFSDSEAFNAQSEKHLISCPLCTSTNIKKALMTPNISKKKSNKLSDFPAPELASKRREALALASQFVERIKKITDDVGDKFPEEARKIHYEEAPARPIWGTASPEEAKELIEEGIDVIPVPFSPKDQN